VILSAIVTSIVSWGGWAIIVAAADVHKGELRMVSKRLYGSALACALTFPALLQGCSDDGSNPLCCTEFKVGATIDANIGGSADSKVAVQAVADLSAVASASVDDITAACRSIANDLDATPAELDAEEAKGDRTTRMKGYCALAVKLIGNFKAKASGTLSVVIEPVKCEASVSAKADCSAKCEGGAQCDIKATPPTCKGGSLQVACKGECTAKAGATLKCEGKCSAECKGSCTAQGGVDCKGKCEGTCKGAAQGGTGQGIQADGTCDGKCEGTCEVTAPGVTCTGSCNGECSGSCTGTAEASVKCDGECKADYEPLKCEGGTLEGGCKVEAKCSANCDASVQAKATCTPPSVTVKFSGAANIEAAGKLQAALEANLGIIATFDTRLKLVAQASGSIAGNVNAVADIKAACIPPVVAAVGQAVGDLKASGEATVSVVGSVK
jgi:hypothetical protein